MREYFFTKKIILFSHVDMLKRQQTVKVEKKIKARTIHSIMKYVALGLGNPEEEYQGTRHNVGQYMLDAVVASIGEEDFEIDKKLNIQKSSTKIGKHTLLFVKSLLNMNANGKILPALIKTPKDRTRLVVLYDDMDLPLGRIKLSYGRSSGGHRGLESVIKALKSRDFLRVRIGISPETSGGKLKKPQGEKQVVDFVLGEFKLTERDVLKKERAKVKEIIETFVKEGHEQAMNKFN